MLIFLTTVFYLQDSLKVTYLHRLVPGNQIKSIFLLDLHKTSFADEKYKRIWKTSFHVIRSSKSFKKFGFRYGSSCNQVLFSKKF